jgi:WD40 repeat protein
MSFLDEQGRWQKDPGEVWEKASAELWYRLWERAGAGQQAELENLATALTARESDWKVIKDIFVQGPATSSPEAVLATFLNALCQLIEFACYKNNAGRPVAEWDQQGRRLSEEYVLKIKEAYGRWGMAARTDPPPGHPDLLLGNLLQGSEIFVKISRLLAEEDRLNRRIKGLLAGPSDPKLRSEAYELILEQLDGAVTWPVDRLQHMVRPCLGLLRHPDIPISSGIQYEAACILGKARDRRCAETAADLLKRLDQRHDNLSASLLYLLGRLDEPLAAETLLEKLKAGSPGDVLESDGQLRSSALEIREAIWALGKQERTSSSAIPVLTGQASNKDRDVKATLAWALGKIGRARLKDAGDIEPEIIAVLLELTKDRLVRVSEEAQAGLKNLELPGLFARLQLHDTAGKELLSLQPSRQGLYELSETLWHLMEKQPPVIMAVTGDSGTGKTYFCQCLSEGFGRWSSKDILYLARDNADHNDIFNRMLGLKFLKKRVLPQFYQNYPLSEEDDRPEEYFEQFMNEQRDKKLIILDGWRDDAYFHHLVSLFNEQERLDVLLKFRATYSTRRMNLEEREGLLENVTTCLSYVEEPNLRETRFHRDGRVLIYQLENSLPARPDREEIRELFQRRKIENWGRFIRLGRFGRVTGRLTISGMKVRRREEAVDIMFPETAVGERQVIEIREKHFVRRDNSNSTANRHLLETIETAGISVNYLALMGPGQVAFGGKEGQVGAFHGTGDRLKYHSLPGGDIRCIAVLGDEIWSIDGTGRLATTSLSKGTVVNWENDHPMITAIASNSAQLIATGHSDGSIRLWSQEEGLIGGAKLSARNITAIEMGPGKRAFCLDQDGRLIVWKVGRNSARSYDTGLAGGTCLCRDPGGRVAVGRSGPGGTVEIAIIDHRTGQAETVTTDGIGTVSSLSACFDGRLLVGLKSKTGKKNDGTLMIINPKGKAPDYWLLPGHKIETCGCLSLGPQILTCGSDTRSDDSLKIWGSADYVKQERKRSSLLDGSMIKSSHFQNIL